MGTFTVGYFSNTSTGSKRGQSFTPNVPGQGSGSPGTATTVAVLSIDIAFASTNTSTRAKTIYIYDHVPSSTDLSTGLGALASSSIWTDGNAFGTGNFTRNYAFSNTNLTPTTKYFIFFATNQSLAFNDSDDYSGGDLYPPSLVAEPHDAQFKVTMLYV